MLIESKVKFENDALTITQRIEENQVPKAKRRNPIMQRSLSSSLEATVAAFSKLPPAASTAGGGPFGRDDGGGPFGRDDGGSPSAGSGIVNIFGPFILLRECCPPEVKNDK